MLHEDLYWREDTAGRLAGDLGSIPYPVISCQCAPECATHSPELCFLLREVCWKQTKREAAQVLQLAILKQKKKVLLQNISKSIL